MSNVSYYLQRARTAFRETGLIGVARRTTRVGLQQFSDSIAKLQRDLLYREARARLTAETRRAAEAMAALRGSLRGRRAFILATGPSLNAVDIEPLGNEITFSVNSFHHHPITAKWQPTYHAFSDHAFFATDGSTDYYFEELRRTFPNTKFIVPASNIELIRKSDWLPSDRLLGIAMDGDFCDSDWDQIDPTMLPMTPNVTMFALAAAIHLGCSPIVLLGVDHSYLSKPFSGSLYSPHFDGQPSIRHNEKPLPTDFKDYHAVVLSCARLWRGYKNLRRIADRDGQVILNASPGSYLDVFPRATLAEILSST